MNSSSPRPWERMIRELHQGFRTLDQEIGLLRDIDQAFLGSARRSTPPSMEELFLSSLHRFSEIQHTPSPVYCYVHLGARFKRLSPNGRENTPLAEHVPAPESIEISAELLEREIRSPKSQVEPRVLAREQGDSLFEYFPAARTILVCPMYSPAKQLLCAFALTDEEEAIGSKLADRDFLQSFAALVLRLEIAYTHHDHSRRHSGMQNLWDTFLDERLSPSECFKLFAAGVPAFFPDLGPLNSAKLKPQVQILTMVQDVEGGAPHHLVIRGTTGAEPGGTRIAIDRSICGLLIERSTDDLPYFYEDPTKPEFRERYKKYLINGDTRAELAVRLVRDKKVIGVLNLESEHEHAFSVHDIHAMLDVASSFAPIVDVFETGMAMNVSMQRVAASTTTFYLDGLSRIFAHHMQTPMAGLRVNLDAALAEITRLRSAIESVSTSIQPHRQGARADERQRSDLVKRLLDLTAAIEMSKTFQSQISHYTGDFATDIKTYGDPGALSLRGVIDAAIDLAKKSLLHDPPGTITIKVVSDESTPEMKVQSSNLLKQHLYTLLANAVLSIRERLTTADARPGEILITIEDERPHESQESKLNQSLRVRLRDNGTGASEAQLERLRKFEPGIRFRESPGQGYGLPAAERYISSIRGRIDLEGELGKFFEVDLHFPYDLSGDEERGIAPSGPSPQYGAIVGHPARR